MDELEVADKTKSKLETASDSIGEIATVISGLKNHPVEYNDLAVRQLIECIPRHADAYRGFFFFCSFYSRVEVASFLLHLYNRVPRRADA